MFQIIEVSDHSITFTFPNKHQSESYDPKESLATIAHLDILNTIKLFQQKYSKNGEKMKDIEGLKLTRSIIQKRNSQQSSDHVDIHDPEILKMDSKCLDRHILKESDKLITSTSPKFPPKSRIWEGLCRIMPIKIQIDRVCSLDFTEIPLKLNIPKTEELKIGCYNPQQFSGNLMYITGFVRQGYKNLHFYMIDDQDPEFYRLLHDKVDPENMDRYDIDLQNRYCIWMWQWSKSMEFLQHLNCDVKFTFLSSLNKVPTMDIFIITDYQDNVSESRIKNAKKYTSTDGVLLTLEMFILEPDIRCNNPIDTHDQPPTKYYYLGSDQVMAEDKNLGLSLRMHPLTIAKKVLLHISIELIGLSVLAYMGYKMLSYVFRLFG